MSNLQKQVIKPFLEDIYRKRSTKAITDHPWDMKALRLETILNLQGTYKTPDGEFSRKEALLREIGELIDEPEEKTRQLLLMYEVFIESDWNDTNIENFNNINKK